MAGGGVPAMKIISASIAVFATLLLTVAFLLLGDGEHITPDGEGVIALEVGNFEAFAMPDYAASVVSDAYKSYFIEVESGIKVHVLEVGQGYPVYLQHGNPTTGLLYRKVAASLPLDRVRLIMPTMVGLGYSTKIPASEHTLDKHMRMETVLTKRSNVGYDSLIKPFCEVCATACREAQQPMCNL